MLLIYFKTAATWAFNLLTRRFFYIALSIQIIFLGILLITLYENVLGTLSLDSGICHIFLQTIALLLLQCHQLFFDRTECLEPLLVLRLGGCGKHVDGLGAGGLLHGCQLEDKLLSIYVCFADFFYVHVFVELDYFYWFVILLALVNEEFHTLERHVPLRPVSITREHHLKVVDCFVLTHLEEASRVLWLKLLTNLQLLIPLDIVEAEPNGRPVYDHGEFLVLLEYHFVVLLLGVTHQEISK